MNHRALETYRKDKMLATQTFMVGQYFFFFLLVNSNTYQNIHENNNNVLNWVYNTLHYQNTTTKGPRLALVIMY